MAEPKDTIPLNGAYYGPPVPAYPVPNPRPHSSFRRLIFSLFKLLISIIIILAVIAVIIWLIFRPNKLKVYVENANLTQFNFTGNNNNNNNLLYNLNLNVSIRNPNKKIGIYYDYIESLAIYDGSRFGFQVLEPFYQGHKNTTVLNTVFGGTGILLGDAPATYAREKAEGFYNVDVKFYMRVRFKAGVIKTHRHVKPKFECSVRLPSPAAGNSKPPPFERTKCDVDY
ncbi:NDR1/HIN1-like protein 10 [Phalaenopsis equestris]|uniref:NDR1/HIN1-like protein 10 n=1 Tax=Phalaenopsis equestris TaxID=78828 RepID=UPI0009E3B80E|nr:NDR1/HIN1-like protein 10 [Phalaenopsis equestris]